MTSDPRTFGITFRIDEVRATLRRLSDHVSDLRLVWERIAVTHMGEADMFQFDPEIQAVLPVRWFPEGWAAERPDLALTAWAVKT